MSDECAATGHKKQVSMMWMQEKSWTCISLDSNRFLASQSTSSRMNLKRERGGGAKEMALLLHGGKHPDKHKRRNLSNRNKKLFVLRKPELGALTGLLTGDFPINYYLKKMGKADHVWILRTKN